MPALVVPEPQSINGLIRSRASTHPHLPILGVPDKSLKFTTYTFEELNSAATLLANYYASEEGGSIAVRSAHDLQPMTCALLAPSGLDFFVNELALVRMGYCVLFVSVNNSPAAMAHLLMEVRASVVVVHPRYESIALEALPLLNEVTKTRIVEQASGDVYSASERKKAIAAGLEWDWRLTDEEEVDLPAFIVHSSGSTGFPKPIVISHRQSVANFAINFNYTGFTTLPIYHNFGHSVTWRGISSLKLVCLFPASDLPLTTSNVLGLLRQPECESLDALFAVPFLYKLLSEDAEGMEILKAMKLCLYGGSVMPDDVGDKLVAQGVKLVGHIGSTEMGQIMTSFRDFDTDKAWNYFRTLGPRAVKNVDKFTIFESVGGSGAGERFECVVKKGWPTMTRFNRPDGDYATSDSYIKHPTIPGAWKFVGRLDDTLLMLNGEKTEPVPLEGSLRGGSSAISDAIVFGASRAQVGALIVLAEGIDPSSITHADLVKLIKPALDLTNSQSPSHSQISPEALVFLPFDTKLPRADKGSFLRPKVYVEFKDVIDGVYRKLEGEDDDGVAKKEAGSEEEVTKYLLDLVEETAGGETRSLKEDTDLFDWGLDSLKATRIRNALQRNLNLNGSKLSSNFVFDRPSVRKMAAYLVALASGDVSKLAEPTQIEQMLQLVDKYKNIEVPSDKKTRRESPSLRVVVLTGVSGSLGAYILDLLLRDPTVQRVYCLIRAKDDKEAGSRVLDSMKTRRLDKDFDGSDSRVISLASDLAQDRLGLKKEVYDEMAKDVTMVIHNAWSVNFLLDVSSFEPGIIGAINLMKLALVPSTPGEFYFSSSVSSVFGWAGPGPVPEAVTESPSNAQNMGYARSKWVVEKLCETITESTPLLAGVLRIGQMVGDSMEGCWNESEAISLIFKTADTLHALPSLDDSPAWLAVDYAAKTILEVVSLPRSASPQPTPCWHIVMPKSVKWSDVLVSLKHAGLKFDVVDRKAWVKLLAASTDDASVNPTKKLLSFFEGKYLVDDAKFTKRYPLETKFTVAGSPSLAAAPLADDVLVGKWVANWRRTGFLA